MTAISVPYFCLTCGVTFTAFRDNPGAPADVPRPGWCKEHVNSPEADQLRQTCDAILSRKGA